MSSYFYFHLAFFATAAVCGTASPSLVHTATTTISAVPDDHNFIQHQQEQQLSPENTTATTRANIHGGNDKSSIDSSNKKSRSSSFVVDEITGASSYLALRRSNRLEKLASVDERLRQSPLFQYSSSFSDLDHLKSNHHQQQKQRPLVALDFNTICTELSMVFDDQCSCAVLDAEESDRIDCSATNGMHAVAHFNQYNLALSLLEVCRGEGCISLYYSNDMPLFCEAKSLHKQTCDCKLCYSDTAGSDNTYGLVGLNVSCPDGSLTTQGCEAASSVLDLGEWEPPFVLSKAAKAGISIGALLGAAGIAFCVLFFIRYHRHDSLSYDDTQEQPKQPQPQMQHQQLQQWQKQWQKQQQRQRQQQQRARDGHVRVAGSEVTDPNDLYLNDTVDDDDNSRRSSLSPLPPGVYRDTQTF